jgi:uncharacterized protein YukE
MTQEDLDQIRAIVREEIANNNETLSAALRTEFITGLDGLRTEFAAGLDGLRKEFRDQLTAAVVAIRREFAERLGAAAVSFSTDFSELRKELRQRIDALDRRMDALEHRMDRVAETLWHDRHGACYADALGQPSRPGKPGNAKHASGPAARHRRACEAASPAGTAIDLTAQAHGCIGFARSSSESRSASPWNADRHRFSCSLPVFTGRNMI